MEKESIIQPGTNADCRQGLRALIVFQKNRASNNLTAQAADWLRGGNTLLLTCAAVGETRFFLFTLSTTARCKTSVTGGPSCRIGSAPRHTRWRRCRPPYTGTNGTGGRWGRPWRSCPGGRGWKCPGSWGGGKREKLRSNCPNLKLFFQVWLKTVDNLYHLPTRVLRKLEQH